MADAGVDVGLFKNDLNLSFDFFQNRTRDILVGLPVPGLFGNGAPTSNAATVDSYGWEFSLNYHFRTGAVNHNIAGNVSDSWNKVIDTKGEDLFFGYDVVSIIKEGYPLYSYYALRNNGLFQSDEEAASSPHLEGIVPRAGDIRYIDKDGNGVINDDDRFVVGNDFPRYTFGLSSVFLTTCSGRASSSPSSRRASAVAAAGCAARPSRLSTTTTRVRSTISTWTAGLRSTRTLPIRA